MQPFNTNNGIVVGLVKDLNDPEGLGRVKVTYPHLGNQESDWARIASPMAGKGRGWVSIPEPDDEVLVAFEQGDPRRPYIVGALWSEVDTIPKRDGKPKENNWRMIQSRSGHIILMDDTKGKEKIVIVDKDGQRKVIIDSGEKKIQVICENGNVEVKAAAGDVTIEALNVNITAQQSLNLKGQVSVNINGTTVNIN